MTSVFITIDLPVFIKPHFQLPINPIEIPVYHKLKIQCALISKETPLIFKTSFIEITGKFSLIHRNSVSIISVGRGTHIYFVYTGNYVINIQNILFRNKVYMNFSRDFPDTTKGHDFLKWFYHCQVKNNMRTSFFTLHKQ